MTFYATFITLALTGLINASYLTFKHFQKKPLVCPINHDCNTVVESKWGHMFGVRNEILGIAYYLAMLIGILIFITEPNFLPDIKTYILIGTSAGFAFSAFLTYLQKFVIREYCFYCLISAAISLLLFINSLAL